MKFTEPTQKNSCFHFRKFGCDPKKQTNKQNVHVGEQLNSVEGISVISDSKLKAKESFLFVLFFVKEPDVLKKTMV